ncbi:MULTISPECIES: tRNA (adenosine(37)-N6)-threonylcarbamoyltransferase complex dimerization subunit type 1 TsaB [unclassified Microbacterium]|uniref:tRNA (adenosine(37)-N6)-threonylcarbamoyltransferase complex dimerization subunit type 1 TsaB n=1 Tax=unclassified Microbacterium TaxID=2609290 RepID=UPI00137C46AE|nr:tRNA (adenosine(37)-N6)-threonylcarbamoyltransferase complex dimerization subunit type 1 TsaB [Microbacterium sp. MAH-37]
MILAVDTSLGSAVAVVAEDGTTVADAGSANPLGHAEVIGDLLQGVVRPGITHVVAGMGPGPFTGLRIGIAAARTFALGRGIPVIPVPSHYAAALAQARTDRFAIITDARRREIAVSVFEGTDADGIPILVEPTRLEPQDAAFDIPVVTVSTIDGAALARVGAAALAAGRTLSGDEPLYLRHPDVKVPKQVRL